MESTATMPAPDAPPGAFRALRSKARAEDAKARRALRGPHPEIWRIDKPSTAALEAAAASPPADCLKRGRTSTVLRVTLADGTPAVLKHYLPTKRIDPRDRCGRSKAMRSLFAADALTRRGFHAVRPLGAWSVPGLGSFLLLEDHPHAVPLQEAVLQLKGAAREALLQELATTVRCLHRSGVAYRDLKPSNILVYPDAVDSARILFLDHDRNRFWRSAVPRRIALRDLAALHAGLPAQIGTSARMRALAAYDPALLQKATWQRFMPAVLREAAHRRERGSSAP